MTTAKRIDGKAKAEQLAESITEQTAALLAEHGIKPGLAVVIIGEDPASQVYVRNKKRRAEACGFHSVQHTLADDTSQDEVLALIDDLNNDEQQQLYEGQHQDWYEPENRVQGETAKHENAAKMPVESSQSSMLFESIMHSIPKP